MICPACDKANPDDARLCAHCATMLANRCDRCGFECPATFHFCGQCGFALGAATLSGRAPGGRVTTDRLVGELRALMPEAFAEKLAAARGRDGGERREVTVLFLDLQGFTRFAEQRDPEAVFQRLDRYRRALVEIIYAHEGFIDKFVGDGLMALFGVPLAHENDPERACRAALAMQARLAEINRDLDDEPLQMRIGLHTGRVVAGQLGPDLRVEYTVLGDVVNVAQRLQEMAPVGSIRASESLFRRVAPLIEAESLGSVAVRGRREPVPSYQILAIRARPATPAQALRSPFVGRDDELAQLDALATRTRIGKGRVLLLSGEAGIGKSRLLAEWQQRLDPSIFHVLVGAPLSYRQPISYWPFITVLQSLFAIESEDDDARCWHKLEAGLRHKVPEVAPNELLPFLAHFLGLPIPDPILAAQFEQLAPPQLRQQSFIALRVLLVTLAFQQPLVLILEDLHWADSATLDLLSFLLGKSEALPLTFVLVTRPQAGPTSTRLARIGEEMGARFHQLALDPLDGPTMGALFEALVAQSALAAPSEGLRERLLARAEGNPFFLEELLRSTQSDEPRPHVGGTGMLLPPSLSTLLTARVDRLPEPARRTLQLASIIGQSFPQALLQHVAAQQPQPLPVAELLPLLEGEGLLERERAEGEPRWRFHHPLLRDTIYHGLLRSERRTLHALVGSSLELLFAESAAPGGTPAQRAEMIAFHYEQAEEWERALPLLMEAAATAAARWDHDTALAYGQRALRLEALPFVSHAQRLALHELLGDIFAAAGALDEAEQHLRHAISLASGGPSWEARRSAERHRRVARLYERRGQYGEALTWLGAAMTHLELDPRTELGVERARTLNDLGWTFYKQGDLLKAQELAFRSLKLLEGSEHLHDLASAYNRLVATYSVQGRWQQAEGYARKSLALRERLGYQPGIASSCQTMATLLGNLGRWPEALGHAERMLTISRTISAPDVECEALILQARLRLALGQVADARDAAGHAVTLAERLETLPLQLHAGWTLARVQQRAGALKQAHFLMLRALELANLLREPEAEAESYLHLAEILAARGKPVDARLAAREALVQAATLHHMPLLEAGAWRVLALAALALSELPMAEMQFRRAGLLFARMSLPYELARTELGVAQLRHAQGRPDEAQRLARRARALFERLGATLDEAEARQLLVNWSSHSRSKGLSANDTPPHATQEMARV